MRPGESWAWWTPAVLVTVLGFYGAFLIKFRAKSPHRRRHRKHKHHAPRWLRLALFNEEGAEVTDMILKVSKIKTYEINAVDEFGNKTSSFSSPLVLSSTDETLAVARLGDAPNHVQVVPTGKLGTVGLRATTQVGDQTVELDELFTLIPGEPVKLMISEVVGSEIDNPVPQAPSASAPPADTGSAPSASAPADGGDQGAPSA